MFFDPVYFLFIMPGVLLSLFASWRVKSAFNKYSEVGTARGLTGAEAAQVLLERAGLHDVGIVPSQGFLSDHYNPLNRTLNLSPDVYSSRSVSAIGVATHEAGHAIQHAHGYFPLAIRSALVPVTQFGSSAWPWVIMAGAIFHAQPLLLVGIAMLGLVVVFQIITLPVEFDASNRAKALVVESGIVRTDERYGMDKVLNAAALTYVAGAITSVLTLLYYLYRFGLLGGRDRD